MPKKKENLNDLEQLSVDELKSMKMEIKNLLASLEDDYRNATVTEKSYKEVKKKNKAKLDKITEILYSMGITDDSEPPAEGKAKAPAQEAAPPAQPAPATPAPVQEGTPAPAPAQPVPTPAAPTAPAVALPPGISEAKFNAEMEKFKLLIDTANEGKKSLDEKILRLTENLGEIRSLVYQREGIAKDQDVKLETMEESLQEVKPDEIAKQFAQRDKTVANHDMRLEKLEFKAQDLIKNLGDIRSLLSSIGGLENIAAVNKQITQKLSTVNDKTKSIERLSNKVEEIFVDMNKKVEDFYLYKAKQETIDELVKELMKSTDDLSLQLKDYVKIKDLDSLKEDIATIGNRLTDLKKLIDMIIPVMRLKIPENIQALQKEKEDIEGVLGTLEDSYRKGKLSRKEFKEAKKKNQQKLEQVIQKLQDEWKQFEARERLHDTPEEQPQESPPATAPQEAAPADKEESPADAEEKPPAEEAKQESETKGPPEIPNEEPKAAPTEPSKETPPAVAPKEEAPKETPAEPPAEETAPATKEEPKKEKKPAPPAEEENPMIAELKDSLKKGLISKEAYEKAKKVIEDMA